MKILLSLFLMLGLIGCSGNKSLEESAEAAGVDVPDQEEFEEDFAEEAGEELADEVMDQLDDSDDEAEVAEDEDFSDDSEASAFSDGGTGMEESSSDGEVAISNDSGEHTVQAGETLMLIAFKIYGDYERWREIARMNSDKLGPRYTVSSGTVLRYNPPAQPFAWSPSGNPYLIKNGDTLGTISSDTYGTNKYWRSIWKNNTPLIKDPNKIVAGFTIYTPELDGRGVANESL